VTVDLSFGVGVVLRASSDLWKCAFLVSVVVVVSDGLSFFALLLSRRRRRSFFLPSELRDEANRGRGSL